MQGDVVGNTGKLADRLALDKGQAVNGSLEHHCLFGYTVYSVENLV